MDTNYKGKITELEVLTYITKLGYSVSLPFGDKDRYDQIWDIDGKLIRVQIKSACPIDEQNSGISFRCTSTSNGKTHPYTTEEVDYFATFWEGKVYMAKVEECVRQKNLRFFSTSKYTNLNQVNWAKDYEVEKILATI